MQDILQLLGEITAQNYIVLWNKLYKDRLSENEEREVIHRFSEFKLSYGLVVLKKKQNYGKNNWDSLCIAIKEFPFGAEMPTENCWQIFDLDTKGIPSARYDEDLVFFFNSNSI